MKLTWAALLVVLAAPFPATPLEATKTTPTHGSVAPLKIPNYIAGWGTQCKYYVTGNRFGVMKTWVRINANRLQLDDGFQFCKDFSEEAGKWERKDPHPSCIAYGLNGRALLDVEKEPKWVEGYRCLTTFPRRIEVFFQMHEDCVTYLGSDIDEAWRKITHNQTGGANCRRADTKEDLMRDVYF